MTLFLLEISLKNGTSVVTAKKVSPLPVALVSINTSAFVGENIHIVNKVKYTKMMNLPPLSSPAKERS